jgi:aminoglycoside phosphotransferase family enzyme
MTAPPEQADVVAFLRQLAGSEPLETHISLVFVGTDTVWKLKKAVRLAFLDFTPLGARRRFTLRELELNRCAAHGLYRDVVPVVRRHDGTLGLGETGLPRRSRGGQRAHSGTARCARRRSRCVPLQPAASD